LGGKVTWKKGQSGNPKGTQSQYMAQAAKVRREVLKKFWAHGEKVLDRLAEEDPRAFMQVVLSVMRPGLEAEAAREMAEKTGSQVLVFGWRVVAPEGGPDLPPPMLVRGEGPRLIEGEVEHAEQER